MRQLIITALLLSLIMLTAIAQENFSLQGCRRGTPRQQSVHLRRGSSEGRIPGGDFYYGERHQLTVLVAFNDKSFIGDEASTMEQWNKIFNVEYLKEDPFKGSVHDYFLAQSYGDFSVVFDLFYVQVSGDAKKYASTYFDDENSQYLVKDIVDILKTLDIDWGKYDWNGDGYVNQLLIVYAGRGMHDSDEPNLIWPHQWWMSDHSDCQPIEVGQGEKKLVVDSYCCVQELTGGGTYGVFGTICHEFSHCLGLPDIYYGSGYSFVDKWDLMDSGNYNEGGFLPCGYSGVERMMVGWITPTELPTPVSITGMKPLATDPEAYIIRNDAYHDEFYVIENRQKVGWDEPLPGSGIVIFHVNYDEGWKHLGWPNQPRVKKDLYIIAANNAVPAPPGWNSLNFNTLGDWAYPYQDNDSLTNNSAPASVLINANADGTKLMSKPIYNMSVRNGLASFDFMNRDKAAAITTTTAPRGTYTVLHTLGKVLIVRYANGEVRKVMR